MITKKELQNLSKKTGLHLYQQEKEYVLKLFVYYYYKRYEDAVFKGGTALRFCYELERFSEDLDFNIKDTQSFNTQVKKTLEDIKSIGIRAKFSKKEIFKEACTYEIEFHGPLYNGTRQTINKIRIGAGVRLKTKKPPEWKIIKSGIPETPNNFLAKVMDKDEILAEKIIALGNRNKGRDLFDTWFLLEMGLVPDKKLIKKKSRQKEFIILVSKKEYVRDMQQLTKYPVSFSEAYKKVSNAINSFVNS